jgi:hypothetical protein
MNFGDSNGFLPSAREAVEKVDTSEFVEIIRRGFTRNPGLREVQNEIIEATNYLFYEGISFVGTKDAGKWEEGCRAVIQVFIDEAQRRLDAGDNRSVFRLVDAVIYEASDDQRTLLFPLSDAARSFQNGKIRGVEPCKGEGVGSFGIAEKGNEGQSCKRWQKPVRQIGIHPRNRRYAHAVIG